MKKIVLLSGIISTIICTSCNNASTTGNVGEKPENGYCVELDTFYKENSVEIKSIKRTFCSLSKEKSRFSISQSLDDKDYVVSITENSEKKISIGLVVLDEKGLESFLKNSKIILANKGKQLFFDFSELGGNISSGGDEVSIYIPCFTGSNSVMYHLNKQELSLIEQAFNKYKAEKPKS